MTDFLERMLSHRVLERLSHFDARADGGIADMANMSTRPSQTLRRF